MSDAVLSDRQLNRATLARQLLLERAPLSVIDAVARLGGLQAQEPKPPFVALWTRLAAFEPDQLHAALHSRAVVRATSMRATLHLLAAADFLAWRAALQPMLTRSMEAALRGRMDGLDLKRVLPAARKLLAQPRSFDALRAELGQAFPEANERALGYAVRTHLPLVVVPSDDRWAFARNAEFALVRRWLKRAPGNSDARPLVRSYLAAFGPASAADVQAWSGLREAKAALEQLRPELVTFADARGRELFDLPDAPRPAADVAAPVRFLAEFDSLMLAHADRRRLIDDEHRPQVITKNLRIRATFLVDGRVAGIWAIERKAKRAQLQLTPFGKLTKRVVSELAREGEALLRFVEPDATSVDVRLA